jgi:hypothetical protein
VADVGAVLQKVRALGADIVLEQGKITIVGSAHLNTDQRNWIAENREAIEQHLRTAVASLPPDVSENDTTPFTWGQFARVLYAQPPENVDASDWSWFVSTAGRIVREELGGVQQ